MANSSLMVLCVTVNDRLMLLIWRAVTFILTFYTLLSGTRDPTCRPTPARVTTVRRGKTLSHFISHSVVFAYWNDIGEDVGFNPNRLIVISIVYVRSIILTTVIKSLNQIIILLILVVFFVHIFYLVFFLIILFLTHVYIYTILFSCMHRQDVHIILGELLLSFFKQLTFNAFLPCTRGSSPNSTATRVTSVSRPELLAEFVHLTPVPTS